MRFLDQEGEGKEFWHNVFEEFSPVNTDTTLFKKERTGRERVWKSYPNAHKRKSCPVRENDTMIHELQYVPLIFDQEEIRKLQEKKPSLC